MKAHISTSKSELKFIKFNEFSPQELIEVLELRQKVFIIEQNCAYPDIDGFDQDSLHVLLCLNHKVIGYARILPSGIRYDIPSFGRFVIDPNYRNRGYAHLLITETLNLMKALYSETQIKIQAQVYLRKFYETYGFQVITEEYPEDDILHVDMVK